MYVDDDRPCPPGWILARTVNDAIKKLSASMYDLMDPIEMVSLDHDISYNIETESGDTIRFESPETFESVARYIAIMPRSCRPDVIFHTANPKGEEAMRLILETEQVPEDNASLLR